MPLKCRLSGIKTGDAELKESQRPYLFWTCYISLVATSFGFISRAFMLADWGKAFGISETQQGEIFGAGLWPFSISMVVFSLIIDRVGYKKAMWFALLCHLVSVGMTVTAKGYESLYWAAFVGALGNGTIEAVINPVIASIYRHEKTKWLNILHAGWPTGLMLAGAITLFIESWDWKLKVCLILLPVLIYGIMLITCPFPVSERVAAKVSYKDMLKELGGIGIFVPTVLIFQELGRVLISPNYQPIFNLFGQTQWAFNFNNKPFLIILGLSVAISIAYGLFVRSAGKPMYILMLIVMLPLATTELGTDGWIKDLMTPAMEQLGVNSGWLLVYTSAIMVTLRFLVGPIMKITRLNPLGLLCAACILVIIGIGCLAKINVATYTQATGIAILVAAFIYGAGQCFFWPTTLGFVAERFPRGGALTLNTIAGVGMLGVGILGTPWLGYIQNTTITDQLQQREPALYEKIAGDEKQSMFGSYTPIDNKKLDALLIAEEADAAVIRKQVQTARVAGKSQACSSRSLV
jgi:MFS family permease